MLGIPTSKSLQTLQDSALEIAGLGNRKYLGMVFSLATPLAYPHYPTGIGSCGAQSLFHHLS